MKNLDLGFRAGMRELDLGLGSGLLGYYIQFLEKTRFRDFRNYTGNFRTSQIFRKQFFNDFKPKVALGSVSYTHLTLPTKA